MTEFRLAAAPGQPDALGQAFHILVAVHRVVQEDQSPASLEKRRKMPIATVMMVRTTSAPKIARYGT